MRRGRGKPPPKPRVIKERKHVPDRQPAPRKLDKRAPRPITPQKSQEPAPTTTAPPVAAQISRVRFTNLTHEYMRNIGAPEITSSVLPSIGGDEREISGTVYDPRMGHSSYWKKKCAQCGQDNQCVGHLGYILLQAPMVNPAAGMILKYFLNIICSNCGRFHVLERIFHNLGLSKYSVGQRLKLLRQDIPMGGKTKYQCHYAGCGQEHIQIKYIKETNKLQQGNTEMQIKDVIELFNTVKSTPDGEKLLNLIGIPDINVFIISVIGVIPPNMRETVRKGAIDMYRDPLKEEYKKIVSINNKIAQERNLSDRVKLIDTLHSNIMRLFEGQKSGAFKFSWIQDKRDYKAILGGKDGHIRHLQMGNRVDHTLRSVLTIDPELDLGTIKVSSTLMDNMYIEEYITPDNISEYNRMLSAGLLIHYTPRSGPHAGVKYEITKHRVPIKLYPGAKVTRHLIDGDWFLFGRNPSIHTTSVMSHKMIRDPGVKTIAIHTATTTPYNADCDGDEGHAKIIQTLLAQAEAKYVTNAAMTTISSETSDVNMGLVIDNLNSIFTMTSPYELGLMDVRDDIRTTLTDMMKNTSDHKTYNDRLSKFNISPQSTRGLISGIFPFGFQYQTKVNDELITIKDGILVQGSLSKRAVGATRNSRNIGRYLSHFWGFDRHTRYLTDVPKVVNYWLSQQHGASVGISDTHINDPTVLIPTRQTVDQLRQIVRILDRPTQSLLEETRIENEIVSIIGKQLGGLSIKLTREILVGPDNNFQPMYLSGAKGDLYHMAQMIAMLGQQYLAGQRLPKTLNNGRRGSVYSHLDSTNLEDRGFVTHSLGEGISPKEMEAHSRAVRENLYNMTTTTAPTGDLHHRLSKAMEDIVIQYDSSVRDTNGIIVDFLPGGVGIDPRRPLLVTHNNVTAPWFTDTSMLIDILNSEIEYNQESISVPG